ncbi:hypothetical protein GCM10027614_30770 [Micromonospora vulcania]
MRLRHASGDTIHLGYCTNVHPAEQFAGILAQLDTYAVPVRAALGSDVLGLGLWLAAPVAAELAADPALRRRLRVELDARGLEVVTLNGFPYAAFQAPVVKHDVYRPDWTTEQRLAYTLNLAQVLADLLPEDAARGSISTLPLAWRQPWDTDRADAARRRLDQLATGLAAVQRDTGRVVRVGFEPEPGCVVESTGQAAALLSGMDTERLGVCLDLAHLACAWEEPAEALDRLRTAGLPVVKVQVSAAVEAADPAGGADALRRWVEPRFLHQTRGVGCAGAADPADPAWAADDLDAALDATLPGPWRVHYHVPLHAHPRNRSAPPCRCCAPRWPRSTPARRPAATTSTWRRTPGGSAGGAAAAHRRGAGRRDRRRAGLRPRRAGGPGPDPGADRVGNHGGVPMSRRLVVLDVVGLTPRLLAHMPRLRGVADGGFRAELGTVLPAVTCSVQSTFLTGEPPSGHGIVGNGWYFRELGEVLLWRQHNALVGGDKLWQTARRAEPGYTVANVCWWYAMGADVNWTVTPRPVYYADGRKEPDCYTDPPELHDALTGRLGTFPLFTYWGPTAGLPSSRWICQAAEQILADVSPDLTLVYVPHLDYDLQRYGPSSAQAAAAAAELDAVLGPLLDAARARDATVVVLSEYGITDVSRPVDVNRLLRAEGLLRVHTQAGMEYLDPWTSRAFAVADHQVAHVYVRDPADLPAVAKLCAGLPGWPRCWTRRVRPRTDWTTLAPASWCWWPSRTRGSPTTTGWTTTTRPTSPGWWRSTASRGTTPPSCSSTRPHRVRPNAAPGWRWRARSSACAT